MYETNKQTHIAHRKGELKGDANVECETVSKVRNRLQLNKWKQNKTKTSLERWSENMQIQSIYIVDAKGKIRQVMEEQKEEIKIQGIELSRYLQATDDKKEASKIFVNC